LPVRAPGPGWSDIVDIDIQEVVGVWVPPRGAFARFHVLNEWTARDLDERGIDGDRGGGTLDWLIVGVGDDDVVIAGLTELDVGEDAGAVGLAGQERAFPPTIDR